MSVPASSGYSAISALIRRVVNLESSVNVQFGTADTAAQGSAFLGANLISDLSANKIVPLSVSSPANDAQPATYAFTSSTFVASKKGDVLRFKNTTLPGDSGSDENFGVAMITGPGAAGNVKYRLAPGDMLKLVCTSDSGATWESATGL